MASYLKSEPEQLQCSLEIVRSIDEKGRLLDLLFVSKFTKKQHGEVRSSRLKQPYMEEFIRCGIDGSAQPVSFVVDPNHRLVDRDLIRSPVASRLSIGLLYPIVNGGMTPLDT